MTTVATPPRLPPAGRPPIRPPGRPPRVRPSNAGGVAGATELALGLLTLAAAVGLARLFRGNGNFLGPVLLTALTVHVVSWACRRQGVGLGLSAIAAAWAASLVLSWTVLGHRTFYGVPTRDTLHAASAALSAAADQFRIATPPAPVVPGFVLASGVGCAVVAFLADWAAFRMGATIEACLPSLSMFVFSAALAQGHRATLAGGMWLGALLVFLLVRQSGIDRPGVAWFASRSGGGPATILWTGAVLGAVALILAVTIGPHLPGAQSKALVDWRGRGTGGGPGRVTSSPLVDIRSRIVDESNVEVFTVTANTPAYWRLTSLDSFDGNGWSLSDTYRHVTSTLPAATGSPGLAVTGNFSISALDSLWLPAPFRPVHYKGPGHVSYSPDAGSLIADKATSDGLAYQVQAVVPTPDPATLEASAPVSRADPSLARELALPSGIPRLVALTARTATRGARTPYEQARMLQDFFRNNFTYDLNVPADDGENAILHFLAVRRGFCQQFAGTYAVMARMLGLPARVAVGFTPGDMGNDGRFHVLDADAHAWPEVWFAGLGWVPFEPTPGRGAPGAQIYTGVTPQQAPPPGSNNGSVPSTPTTAPAPSSTPTTAPRSSTATTLPTSPATAHHRSSTRWALETLLWVAGVALLLGIVPAISAARRYRRRAAATTPQARVSLAWSEASEDLARLGARRRPSDTPAEYATTAAKRARLDPPSADAISELASVMERVSYAAGDASDSDASTAEAARAIIAERAAAARSRWERFVTAIDPRQLAASRRS